jgi:hypothetical protein
MSKKRYKVTLNWCGEIKTFWTHANSEAQARAFVVKEFGDEIGREPFSILSYFNQGKDNIKIEEKEE